MYPTNRWRSLLAWSLWNINIMALMLILLGRRALETFRSNFPTKKHVKLFHLNINQWFRWENVPFLLIFTMLQDLQVFSFKIENWNFSLAFLLCSIPDFLVVTWPCFHIKWCKALNIARVKFISKFPFKKRCVIL